MMSLMHVGSLTKLLTEEFKDEFSGVRWSETSDYQTVVADCERDTDTCRVWGIIREELPGIRRYCENSRDVLVERMDSHERQIYKATAIARGNMGNDTIVDCAEPGGAYFGKIIGMLWGHGMDVIAIQKVLSNRAVLHMVADLPRKASVCIGDVLTIIKTNDGKSDIHADDWEITELLDYESEEETQPQDAPGKS
jgi:hypothetical protein